MGCQDMHAAIGEELDAAAGNCDSLRAADSDVEDLAKCVEEALRFKEAGNQLVQQGM